MSEAGPSTARWSTLAILVACTSCLGVLAGGIIAVTAGVIGVFWAGLLPVALLLGLFVLWVSGILAPDRRRIDRD